MIIKTKICLSALIIAIIFYFPLLWKGVGGEVLAQHDSIPEGYGDSQNIEVIQTREAHYPEGDVAFYTLFYYNIKYTKEAIADTIRGEVTVSFMIEADSTITEIKLLKDVGYGCGEEIVRILKGLKFVPAVELGTPVRTNLMLSIPIQAHER